MVKIPLTILAGLMLLSACGDRNPVNSDNNTANESAKSPPQAAANSKYFKTEFQDESEFIVETIVADIAEQVFYAKNKTLPIASGFSVTAVEQPSSRFRSPDFSVDIVLEKDGPPINASVSVDDAIWSP